MKLIVSEQNFLGFFQGADGDFFSDNYKAFINGLFFKGLSEF